jgi:DNA-binding PadR family transcriptional regulator
MATAKRSASPPAAPELTTTSYAILGLLAIKPWTTYELAQQMDRALGQFWPRAESKLYDEPKKLVARGFAKATSEQVGRRPRTIYSITPKGRRSLTAWMSEPARGPVLEFEQLVKVFFAENGTTADLRATIEAAREWSRARIAASASIPASYVRGEGAFPERLPWLLLVGQFLTEFLLAVERWSEWAAGVVEGWPDDVTAAEPDWATLEAQATLFADRA